MSASISPLAPSRRSIDSRRLEALVWTFAHSSEVVVVADAQGRLVWLNRLPVHRNEAIDAGADVAALFPAEFEAAFRAAHQRVLAGGAEERVEWGERNAAGIVAWHLSTISALGGAAGPAGFLSRSTDLTALKTSEERLRRSEALMVDTQGVAHLGTWEWNVSEPHASWSAELYRIYGLTPETYTPSYEQYLTKVHPDDRQRVIDATNAVFHQHVPYSHDERIFRPDGSIRYLHTWAHPVRDDQGKLVKLVGVCQDITERKLAEEEVLRLNRELEQRVVERTRQLEQSLQDLESFNAMVSHDLRNPLNAIDLSCAMLERLGPQLPPKAQDYLSRVRRSASRMGELIRDLLTLSKVGHVQLVEEMVDLGAISSEIVAGFVRTNPERRVEVRIGDSLQCRGDPGLLRAAMENLIANAWKYTSKVEDAQLEVGSRTEGGRTVFFVRDNGAGFDMAEAHRLFRIFERLHAPEDFPGTGVGLAAVHRILERHGGRIWAEGRPGAGATFSFVLSAP